MNLNEAQEKAVNIVEGPALILAGPGSGKTAVITQRIARLLEKGIDEENILVITFTKAAAVEMQGRYEKLSGKTSKVSFGTFHSIFFKILKFAQNFNASNIIRDEDSNRFILNLIDEYKLETMDMNGLVADIKAEISSIKGRDGIIPEKYVAKSTDTKVFREIYRKYIWELDRRRLIDFDDMLLKTYELLSKDNEVLEVWREKYQYIMIDEFQDINTIQYKIIGLLALPKNNLFIVGDDDQSIYGFRGANPRIMKQFKEDYPDCMEILLNYNYRSKKNIVEMAGKVISNNKNRFEKEIKTIHEAGSPIEIHEFRDTKEENLYIVDVIKEQLARGVLPQNIAVLLRTNSQANHLTSAFMKANIRFVLKDTCASLYDHWAVMDVMAYIFMALGDRKRERFLRVMNRPKRFFSRDMILDDPVDFNKIKERYREKRWVAQNLEKLEYDFRLIARGTPFSAVTYVRRGVGYDNYIREYAKEHGIHEGELLEVLDELLEDAMNFKEFNDWFDNISKLRQELIRQKEIDKSYKEPAVVISTMHSSKGLEYDVVIVPDCIEGITPYKKAVSEDDIEEERRLFYVAMTRAKMFLYLSNVRKYAGKEKEKSRFLLECSDK